MNLDKNWGLRVDESVYRRTAKFPAEDQRRVFEMIATLKNNPYAGDIEKIKGVENKWRRRIGAYRVFYKIYQESRTVLVVEVERRGSHTY